MNNIKTIEELVAKFSETTDQILLEEIALNLMESYNNLKSCAKIKDEKALSLLHSCGIKLWNIVIAKKAKKTCSSSVCVQGRHISLHLTFMASFDDQSQTTSRKQLAMALKTGRDWLDNGNIEMADKCFVVATECYMKLEKLVDMSTISNQIRLSKDQLEECQLNMLRVYAFRSEVGLKQSQQSMALEYFAKALAIYTTTNHQLGEFLYNISYNFGLDCYQKELFRHCVEWLCESINLAKGETSIPKEKQATTYQLLAISYIELKDEDSLNKALQAIETSNQFQAHMKSNYLHLKVAVLLNQDGESILKVFNSICLHPQLDIDMALQYVGLLSANQKLCEQCLEIVNTRFPLFTENIKVQLKKLELFLSEKKIDSAKDLIDAELIRINNHGIVFDKITLKQLQLLLWEQAQEYFEKSDHMKSLQWYNYSLEFMRPTDDTVNMAKLQRNRCSCFIELQQYEEALTSANSALENDKNSPQTYFLLYKIYLVQNNEEKAVESVDKLTELNLQSDDSETIHGLICLAAQLAFEKGNRNLSEIALDKILLHVKDDKQALITIRCLARLKFTYLSEDKLLADIKGILSLIQKAYNHLKELVATCVDGSTFVEETSWFNKIAWNVALSCKGLLKEMFESFNLCYQISLLLPIDQVNPQQQKTCLLMAAGCSLALLRETKSYDNEKNNKLLDVLGLIKKCTDVCENIGGNGKDPTLKFLLSYEFEAKARLGYKDMDDLLEKTLQINSSKAKVFENFAGVAFSLGNKEMNSIGVKALKLAIKTLLEEENKNFEFIGKAVHNLINMTLDNGSVSNATSKEDAYNCYIDALNVVEKIAKDEYPEMELVWLMTKAWNCGIYLYSANHKDAAEKWCTISMKFLHFLKELKSSYEPHMTTVFADIISRIEETRAHSQVEE